MRTTAVAIVAFVALVVLGVVGMLFWGQWQVSRAEDRWAGLDIDSYSMEVEVRCFCGLAGRFTLEVADGRVVEYDRLAGGPPRIPEPPTVDRLLSHARERLGRQPVWPWERYSIDVQVNDAGLPIEVMLQSRAAEDDYLGWTILDFDVP